jgi:fructose-1,6-bisphosphatase I
MADHNGRAQVAIGDDIKSVLAQWSGGDPGRASLSAAILAMADACAGIAAVISAGPHAEGLAADAGSANADGDSQKRLDVLANDLILAALRETSVAYFASEEEDAILTLTPTGDLAVATDPLDGSSNIDANISIGTIFSIFPASKDGATESFFRPGAEQLAAGYAVYGPHTALVLTTGAGVDCYVLDPASRRFRLAAAGLKIPGSTREYAINASNYRHWFDPVRTFIDDCLSGAEGPRGKDFNMRWVASLVAETHRIFTRGGVFLYPGDRRTGYAQGRLRLLYEAAPIAMLVEQAGGGATDGATRILEKVPTNLHERTPLVFGSAEKVALIASYHNDPSYKRASSPLFGERGLFRS